MCIYIFTANTVYWMVHALLMICKKAVQYKMPAVAITDQNSLAGASRLWHQCIKAGIKPIIGLEMQFGMMKDDRVFQ